jgi:hypothetical protein
LETAICEAARVSFGPLRIYLNIKKKVGTKGKTQNIPDAKLSEYLQKQFDQRTQKPVPKASCLRSGLSGSLGQGQQSTLQFRRLNEYDLKP